MRSCDLVDVAVGTGYLETLYAPHLIYAGVLTGHLVFLEVLGMRTASLVAVAVGAGSLVTVTV